jgi:hypothetical protein
MNSHRWTTFSLGLILALCPGCDKPGQDSVAPGQEEAPSPQVSPPQDSDAPWKFSDWFNARLHNGMSLGDVEALLGKDYTREEAENSFTLDFIYDDGSAEVPNGAVVGISLFFERDELSGWICSVQREP